MRKTILPFMLVIIVLPLVFLGSASMIAHGAGESNQLEYIALGDSLPFGYQPNRDFTHGYVTDLFSNLRSQAQYTTLVNLSCSGETTATFINGDPNGLDAARSCLSPQVQASNQLASALNAIRTGTSPIGLVTLQVGINDFLVNGAIDPTSCTINPSVFDTQLATVDHNLSETILPQLQQALAATNSPHAQVALVGYYDPLLQLCPASVSALQTVNQHLALDAGSFASFIAIDDLVTTANVCQLTWICSATSPDIHPTDQGYELIAQRIDQTIIPAWTSEGHPLYNPGQEVTYQGNTYVCLRQIWGQVGWEPTAPGIADNFWQQISSTTN
jgi:lysophospholipase L1-like esterase